MAIATVRACPHCDPRPGAGRNADGPSLDARGRPPTDGAGGSPETDDRAVERAVNADPAAGPAPDVREPRPEARPRIRGRLRSRCAQLPVASRSSTPRPQSRQCVPSMPSRRRPALRGRRNGPTRLRHDRPSVTTKGRPIRRRQEGPEPSRPIWSYPAGCCPPPTAATRTVREAPLSLCERTRTPTTRERRPRCRPASAVSRSAPPVPPSLIARTLIGRRPGLGSIPGHATRFAVGDRSSLDRPPTRPRQCPGTRHLLCRR